MSEVLKCPLTNFYRREINCSKHVVIKSTQNSAQKVLSRHHGICSLQQQHSSFCDLAPVQRALHWLGFYRAMSCRSLLDTEKTQALIAPHLACHLHRLRRGHWVCYDGLPLQTEQCRKPERKTTCCPQKRGKNSECGWMFFVSARVHVSCNRICQMFLYVLKCNV